MPSQYSIRAPRNLATSAWPLRLPKVSRISLIPSLMAPTRVEPVRGASRVHRKNGIAPSSITVADIGPTMRLGSCSA